MTGREWNVVCSFSFGFVFWGETERDANLLDSREISSRVIGMSELERSWRGGFRS